MSNLFEESGAEFSPDRKHRYMLSRTWNNELPKIAFVGLNPSTADEMQDDPTIRRVIRFARDWGYGGVYMLNLFSMVTPYPKELKAEYNQENKAWHEKIEPKVTTVLFAWGAFKEAALAMNIQDHYYKNAREKIFCLGKNANRSPKHPLYINSNTKLQPYV